MRAKFHASAVTDFGNQNGQVKLTAVYATSSEKNKEDNEFAAATPYGNIEMNISNPACFGFIKAGRKYYVDFTECPEDQQ